MKTKNLILATLSIIQITIAAYFMLGVVTLNFGMMMALGCLTVLFSVIMAVAIKYTYIHF